MLERKKILLPVDFPNTSFRVIRQAAILARHFHSEIVMLHVVTTPQRRTAGVPDDGPEAAGWDMLAEITRGSEKNLESSLGTSQPRWSSDSSRAGEGRRGPRRL